MPRDSQRQALYTWESHLRIGAAPTDFNRQMDLGDCQAFSDLVCEDLGIVKDARPSITITRADSWTSAYTAWRNNIKLANGMKSQAVILHELGHFLMSFRAGRNHKQGYKLVASHGPEFASLVLWLYGRYADVNKLTAQALAETLKPRRVRFSQERQGDWLSNGPWRQND